MIAFKDAIMEIADSYVAFKPGGLAQSRKLEERFGFHNTEFSKGPAIWLVGLPFLERAMLPVRQAAKIGIEVREFIREKSHHAAKANAVAEIDIGD